MTKILFTDIDGTLLDDKKQIPFKNRQAIEQLIKEGHKIVLTTGRALSGTIGQAEKLGLTFDGCYIIAFNGAEIYDSYRKETLYKCSIPLDVVSRIFAICEEQNVHVQTYDDKYVLAKEDNAYLRRYCREIVCESKIDPSLPHSLKEEPSKLLLLSYDNPDKLNKMRDLILKAEGATVDSFMSSKGLLEVVLKGTNKGNAIKRLCHILDIPLENSVGAGDGYNDIELIRTAHVGAAMKNAVKEIQEIADYITEADNNEGGLAEVITKFIL
ncbi:MAG: HAD family hydrolase [Lachnospiraceae bacterium]|nr:HAD family hydrolase [Lachnospiraceae bacterium]